MASLFHIFTCAFCLLLPTLPSPSSTVFFLLITGRLGRVKLLVFSCFRTGHTQSQFQGAVRTQLSRFITLSLSCSHLIDQWPVCTVLNQVPRSRVGTLRNMWIIYVALCWKYHFLSVMFTRSCCALAKRQKQAAFCDADSFQECNQRKDFLESLILITGSGMKYLILSVAYITETRILYPQCTHMIHIICTPLYWMMIPGACGALHVYIAMFCSSHALQTTVF